MIGARAIASYVAVPTRRGRGEVGRGCGQWKLAWLTGLCMVISVTAPQTPVRRLVVKGSERKAAEGVWGQAVLLKWRGWGVVVTHPFSYCTCTS